MKEVTTFRTREMQGARFPHLARIAFAMLGLQASSAGLGRDFCPVSDIMNRKRGSLNPATGQAQLMLRINEHLLPKMLRSFGKLKFFLLLTYSILRLN